MLKKLKSAKSNMTRLLNAQETLDTVLEEEYNINWAVESHGVKSVEELISLFPGTAYDEDDIPLDEEKTQKEIKVFYEKRKQDFADALEDFRQSDIYESYVKVKELYMHYEKLVKQ